MLYLSLFLSFIISILLTPIVKRIAFRVGATDCPDDRKVHQKTMPRLGGISIYVSFSISLLLTGYDMEMATLLLLSSLIILLTGIMDDLFGLKPKLKLLGQSLGASIFIIFGDAHLDVFSWIEIEWLQQTLSFGMSFLWIILITNSINIIDGLDGLASGLSGIMLFFISIFSINQGNYFISALSLILLSSILGFLLHNFYPAKIFLGDTGSLFIGYMIATISLLTFDTSTVDLLITPFILIGIPILDTIYAIIRRITNNKSLFSADKGHLHHQLINSGFSHRTTVIILYILTTAFGLIALMLTDSQLGTRYLFFTVILVTCEILAEHLGCTGHKYRPLLNITNSLLVITKKAIKIR